MLLDRLAARRAWQKRQRRGFDITEPQPVGWMTLATAGMLHPGQVALMQQAIRELPSDAPVVEIGSWAGLSTNILLTLLRQAGRPNRLYSTDPWDFERTEAEREHVPNSDVSMGDLRAHVMEQFERNTRLWNGDRLPYAFELTSDEFFQRWHAGHYGRDLFGREVEFGGPISFAFIDGDHRLEQAERDFDNTDAALQQGGFVLFDDSDRFGAWPHLYQLVQRILRERPYELVGENPHHLIRRV